MGKPRKPRSLKRISRQQYQQDILAAYCEAGEMNFGLMIAQDASDTVIETMVGEPSLSPAEFSEQVVLALCYSLLSKLSEDADMEFTLDIGTVKVERNDVDAQIISGGMAAQVEDIKARKELDG